MNEKTITCAVILNKNSIYTVDNLIVFDSPSAIPAVKAAMGYDYLIPVDERVQIGDIYDAERDIFTRDGERVYPDLSDKERLTALETAQNDTELALIELAEIIGGTNG